MRTYRRPSRDTPAQRDHNSEWAGLGSGLGLGAAWHLGAKCVHVGERELEGGLALLALLP